jgi:transcriptional regulator with XRE-family HTH domain
MPSFRISISPSRRAAARFVTGVRRSILQALEEEEKKRGLKQSDIAREIGVHRSVINRELRGKKDIGLGRIAELAFALGRVPKLDLSDAALPATSNLPSPPTPTTIVISKTGTSALTAQPQRDTTVARAAA